MRRRIPVLLFSFLLTACVAAPADAADEQSIQVRVCVIENADRITLVLAGPYTLSPIHSNDVLKEGRFLRSEVTVTKGGILIGGDESKTAGIAVRVSQDSSIFVNGRRLRGSIDIIRTENVKLLVVNRLDVERYLYGVLYHEVSHLWPLEVLKAQAIAARTFALYQRRQNKNKDYDLRDDIYSQVYGGRASERWLTNRAVNLTRDQVLTYKGDLFPAYYHATCAGHTEDASQLWNVDIPPLKGVECPYCKGSPHFQWHKTIPLAEIKEKLNSAGYKLDDLASISILSRDASNRIEKLELRDKAGAITIVTAKDFRMILDPNTIRSANFEIEIKGGNAVINGLGWGHGVGMCQWGAYGMARAGKKTGQILKFYYPGAEIKKIDAIRDKL